MVINRTPYEYYLVWKSLPFTLGFGLLGAILILVPLLISFTTNVLNSEWSTLLKVVQIDLLIIGIVSLFVAAPDFRPAKSPEQLFHTELTTEERETLAEDHDYFKSKRGF